MNTDGIGSYCNVEHKRHPLFDFLFISILIVPLFGIPSLSSSLYFLVMIICVLASGLLISKNMLKLLSPIYFFTILGVMGFFIYPFYDAGKDFWYLLKVILTFSVGYLLMEYIGTLSRLITLLIISSLVVSVIHIFQVVIASASGISFYNIRYSGINSSLICSLSLSLLLGLPHIRRYIKFTKIKCYSFVIIMIASIILSMSRTFIISFFIGFAVFRGWLKVSLRSMVKILVILGLLGGIVLYYNSCRYQHSFSFGGKLINSMSEIAIKDYNDMSDINLNWRGYEAYRALLAFKQGNFVEKIFGQGFGSKVDLGFSIKLGESNMQFIPILHNGYVFVLFKFGFIGLFIYIYFVLKLIRFQYKKQLVSPDEVDLATIFIRSIGFIIAFTTLIISGVFNKSQLDGVLILLGALFAFVNIQVKKYNMY